MRKLLRLNSDASYGAKFLGRVFGKINPLYHPQSQFVTRDLSHMLGGSSTVLVNGRTYDVSHVRGMTVLTER